MNRAEKRRMRKLSEKAARVTKPVQSASSSPDQQTLTIQQAIDLAVQHHNAGRLPEAESIYQQILQTNPDQPDALHMLGVIAHQVGTNEISVDLITKALAIKPDYAEAHSNLGVALKEQGKLDEAVASYHKALAIKPDYAEAHNNLGNALKEEGKLDDAVASYHKALAIKPDYADAHNNLGNALKELSKLDDAVASYHKALTIKPDYAEAHSNLGVALQERGNLDEAVASHHKALAINPDYAEAHSNLGVALQEKGKLNEAVASYHKALAIKPDYAEAHYNIGNALKEQGNLDEAVASYHKALVIRPNYADAHSNLGNALKDQGKLDEAVASHHKALAINPDYAEAHYNLCFSLESTNSTEALREAVNNAQRSCPGHPLFTLGEAQLLKRDGDYVTARTVLEAGGGGISNAHFLMGRAFLLGDLCDRLGDAEAAYNFFEEGNRRSRETPEAKQSDGARYLAQIDVLDKRFTSGWVAGWRHLESGNDRSDPVFLVGFPRSGTTLLDTILRSHRAISVVEEMPTLTSVLDTLVRLSGSYPDGLAELDSGHLQELRQIYFTEIDNYLEPQDRSNIVVDKLPLNTVNAGLIHRIFPRARFLFALRHPCDCVLSCFMQNFSINDAMANFHNLDDAALCYDKVMSLWQQYQAVLPLDIHTLRYESLVEEFEKTLIPLFDFLGVGWDDGVSDYTETAQSRGLIKTPSYNQVTQPLYTRSRGRWERYHEQMQSVLPTLMPWARRFGYDE